MLPDVINAIEEIRKAFPGHAVETEAEPQGGAYVIVRDLPIGEQFSPTMSWVGFLIDYQYPITDVYPLFIDGTVMKGGCQVQGQGFSYTNWRGKPALQLSRRTNNRIDISMHTAALKVIKVLEWLKGHK